MNRQYSPYQGSGLTGLNNLIEASAVFFLFRFLKGFTDFQKILDKNLDLEFFSIQQNKLYRGCSTKVINVC